MNIPQIVIADVVSIYMLFILLIEAQFQVILGDKESWLIRLLIKITMISSVFDMVLDIIDGKQSSLYMFINYYGNIVIFATPVMITWCWLYFIFLFRKKLNGEDSLLPFGKLLSRLLLLPGCIVLTLCLIQVFTPVIFYIDNTNIYHRLPPSWICVGVMFFYIIISCLFSYRRNDRSLYKSGNMVLFVLPIIAGTGFQFLFNGVSTIFPAITTGLVGFYISCHNDMFMRDRLTGLPNRTCFLSSSFQQSALSRKDMGIVMIDVDCFKQINDSFGHLEGDNALKAVADILRDSAGRKDLVFRYAGDEFLIVTYAEDPCHLQELTESIDKQTALVNAQHRLPCRLGLSCGTARKDPADTSFDAILKRADAVMYEVKERKKI